LFPAARELGELTAKTSEDLWKKIPEFEPVPAYITGYLMRKAIKLPIHDLTIKVIGKKNRRIVITQGLGEFSNPILRRDSRIKTADPKKALPIIVDGINSAVRDSPHFYANTGALAFGIEKWQKLVGRL
jgi:hypothetical protein